MQVTILGANGKVGQEVTRLCLERGYKVTAMVHSRNPFEAQSGLTIIKGDVYNPDDIEQSLAGSQAVISALGSWHTKKKNVLASAIASLIPAMEKQSIKRIITVTGAGAGAPGDTPTWAQRGLHVLLGLVAPKILADGEAHIQLLQASKLDWTTIRSAPMSKQRSTTYVLRNTLSLGLIPIARLAVATAMVDQLERTDFLKQAPVIYSR